MSKAKRVRRTVRAGPRLQAGPTPLTAVLVAARAALSAAPASRSEAERHLRGADEGGSELEDAPSIPQTRPCAEHAAPRSGGGAGAGGGTERPGAQGGRGPYRRGDRRGGFARRAGHAKISSSPLRRVHRHALQRHPPVPDALLRRQQVVVVVAVLAVVVLVAARRRLARRGRPDLRRPPLRTGQKPGG